MKAKILTAILLAGTFAAGREAAKLKFPWAGETLNRPCGKTEIEWRAATRGLSHDAPVPITPIFEVTAMRGEVKRQGLLVTANVRRREGVVHPYACRGWAQGLRDACGAIHKQAVRRYGQGDAPGKPFYKWNGIAVMLYVDGNLSMQAVGGQYQGIPWKKRPAGQ